MYQAHQEAKQGDGLHNFFKNCLLGDIIDQALKTKGRTNQLTILGILIHKYRMGRSMSKRLRVHGKRVFKIANN